MLFGSERLHRVHSGNFLLGLASHRLFAQAGIRGAPSRPEIFVLDRVQEQALAARVDEAGLRHRVLQRILPLQHIGLETVRRHFEVCDFLLLVVELLEHIRVAGSDFGLQPLLQILNLLVEGQAELIIMFLSLGQYLLVLLQTFLARPELANFIHHQAHGLLHGIHLRPERPQPRLGIIGTKLYLLTPWARAQSVGIFVIVVLCKLLEHHGLRGRIFEASILVVLHAGARI